ncbi:MAG TPA: cation:proton antiporter [Stellaceae bacterium]|nr:cation:proton antiporter [Stellaceae bacterium]
MLDTALVLAAVAVLLVVVGAIQPLAAKLRLPPAVVLAGFGIAIGTVSGLLSHTPVAGRLAAIAELFGKLPITSETIIYVFLPLLVFEAGITSDVRRILEDAAPILLLAIVATLVTTAAIGLALWPLAGVPLVVCLLVGSVVATTDPAAVIAIFRDVGAPARLTRLVEGEALLNDAAAIALFVVLLGMILSGREPDVIEGAREFAVSFVGGAALGVVAGRILLGVVPWLRDDRLAEAGLTVALAYLAFILGERVFHVSGVVAVLVAGLTVSAFGRARITPYNWKFLGDLWEQVAFWARSLVFVLASIVVPRLLINIDGRDLLLTAILIGAAFAARIVVLFLLMPPLSYFRLAQPIGTPYKLAITWGGLRGALTLALALAVTENPALSPEIHHFVAVLATGLVLFTLLVSGTTLRPVIRLLGLDRLSPSDRVLRDQVLALAYEEVCEAVRGMAQQYALPPSAVTAAIAPYEASIHAASVDSDAAEGVGARSRLGIALLALANQERALVLDAWSERTAPAATVQVLLRNADALIEGARSDGRLGYKRAIDAALSFRVSFRFAYMLYRRFGFSRLLAIRLGERFEALLFTRLLITELVGFSGRRLDPIFEARIADLAQEILSDRLQATTDAVEALRHQYPDPAAALETEFLRQSASRREMGRYQALFEEGLIAREIYDDLRRSVDDAQSADRRPRFDLGLDTHTLIARLDLLSGLDVHQLERVRRLLRPRFTVPNERIIKEGERADAVYFIASGTVEVRLPQHRVQLSSGDFFGEMALLTNQARRADVVALTCCRLLRLGKADFERFMAENPDARAEINRIAYARQSMNEAGAVATEEAKV